MKKTSKPNERKKIKKRIIKNNREQLQKQELVVLAKKAKKKKVQIIWNELKNGQSGYLKIIRKYYEQLHVNKFIL